MFKDINLANIKNISFEVDDQPNLFGNFLLKIDYKNNTQIKSFYTKQECVNFVEKLLYQLTNFIN